MVRIIKTSLVAGFVLMMLAVGQSQAELYKFSGVLPTDASDLTFFTLSQSMVSQGLNLGDTWTMVVDVDESAPADQPVEPTFASYQQAVRSSQISFSSGYSLTLTPDYVAGDTGSIYVSAMDTGGGAFPAADGMSAEVSEGQPAYMYAAILNETDLGSLPDPSLPGYPTDFDQSLLEAAAATTILDFKGADGGWIKYDAWNVGSFEVVPEPSTITLWCVAGLTFGLMGWRKRRAA